MNLLKENKIFFLPKYQFIDYVCWNNFTGIIRKKTITTNNNNENKVKTWHFLPSCFVFVSVIYCLSVKSSTFRYKVSSLFSPQIQNKYRSKRNQNKKQKKNVYCVLCLHKFDNVRAFSLFLNANLSKQMQFVISWIYFFRFYVIVVCWIELFIFISSN